MNYCEHQFSNEQGRWDRYCYRQEGHEGKHMHKSGEWFEKKRLEAKKPMYLPWMYSIVMGATNPHPVLFECPLCFAVIASPNIKNHTAYHESRGEEDNGTK